MGDHTCALACRKASSGRAGKRSGRADEFAVAGRPLPRLRNCPFPRAGGVGATASGKSRGAFCHHRLVCVRLAGNQQHD